MRTLSTTLQAAVKAQNQEPTLSVTLQDLATRWTTLASGLADGRFSLVTNQNGALACAALSQGADPNTISTWVVSNPTTAASWTSARTAITADAAASAGVSLCMLPNYTIRCHYQRTSDLAICLRDSTDNGVTFGAEQVLAAAPLAVGNLCYGICSDGASVWAIFASYSNAACILYRWTGTAWSNEGPASPTWGLMRGISCTNAGGSGYTYFACGVQTRAYQTGIALGFFYYNQSAGTYTGISTIVPLDTPSLGLSYAPPTIWYGSDGLFYVATTLVDDGSLSGTAGNRTTIYRTTPTSYAFGPYAHLGQAFQYGCAALISGGQLVLAGAPSTVFSPAPAAATDLSNDVLALHLTDAPHTPSHATITLANDQGQYNSVLPLRADASLTISLGYGTETVTTHSLLIDSIHSSANADTQTVEITARDHLRDFTYHTGRILAYTNQTVSAILQSIVQQAGATLGTLPGTSQFSTAVPCFLIKPGDTWQQALDRLAAIYLFDAWCDSTPQIRVVDRSPGDASTWTYSTDQILALAYGQVGGQPNTIRVTGTTSGGQAVFADVVDSADLQSYGRQKLVLVVEKMCDTAAKCSLRANQELRDAKAARTSAQLTVPLNPAHELMDVITITDSALAITSQTLRIHAMTWHIDTETGTWDHILTCLQP